MPLAAEFYRLGLGEPIAGLGGPGPRAPATCWTASSSCCPRTRPRGGRRDDRAPRGHRPPERRQVLAGQQVPGRGAGDRLRRRRHDARRDRPAARGRRPPGRPRRHRRACAARPRSPSDVEYYTALRSQRAAERADVALVVCDATDGVTAQDLRIAELAMGASCATALVLNKWDVTRDGRGRPRPRARQGPPEAAPAAQGADGQREDRAQRGARAAARRSRSRDRATQRASPRPELNRLLSEALQARQPPVKQGHRLKLIYCAQIGQRPPRFAIQVNNRATRDPRVRLLPREPPACAVRPRRRPGDHRLQRAQAAAQRALAAPAQVGGGVHRLAARRLDLQELQAVPAQRTLADAGAQDAEPRAVVELRRGRRCAGAARGRSAR